MLRDDRASHNPPSPGELASFEARERAWADEVMRARVEAARAHREQRSSGRQNGKRTLDLPLNEDNVATAGPTVEERLEERSQNSSSVNPDSMPLRLRTSSAEMPWYHPHKVGGDAFPWPKDRNERNRAQVFYDLWKKGHFLSSGSKFGANYLAYPGTTPRLFSLIR